VSLQAKVIQLKLEAAMAVRVANGWQKLIDTHGEVNATDFYSKHLGLNHLEKKSVTWEGLTLYREPKEHEKLCLKSIAQAQESGKESVGQVLLSAREELIDQGMKKVKKLDSSTYHELVINVTKDTTSQLKSELETVLLKGKSLVISELSRQKAADDPEIDDDDEEEVDHLSDLTGARVANDVQSRITAAITRFALLGLVGSALYDAVRNEVETGSVSYVDRAAQGATNKVLNFGRAKEARARKEDWTTVEYSAILDSNSCDPCASQDGEQASDESDLTPTPNPDCLGTDLCRCFHVFIYERAAA